VPNLDKNPQAGVGGTSYLYDFGTSPNTRTAVNQKVRLLTPHYGDTTALHQMGVLSSFNPTQSRTVEPVRGIGFGDKVAELVPSVTEPTTGSFERALLYLCNLWQAAGYAAGVDGPVRSLAEHRWPFDIEQQLVFSVLADADLGAPNIGVSGQSGTFDGGIKSISFPQVTNDNNTKPGEDRGATAIITIYEACWFNSWSVSFAKDAGMIMETGDVTVSDVHDFASVYGEFLATGNDPTIGQLGSIRFAEQGFTIAQAGRGAGGGGSQSLFAAQAVNVPV
jgi:hypothetical protein